MDEKYNRELDDFSANQIHYNDYKNEETTANITGEPYNF